MDYAVVFYFDYATENKIQKLINRVANHCGNEYMIKTKIPPHVTVSAVKSDDENLLIYEVEKQIGSIESGDICFASIGIFNPNVIFLAPVLNEYLINSCNLLNEKLLVVSEVSDNGNYLQYQWVPHTAIATKLSKDELKKAFEIVQSEFNVFVGKTNRIALARCNPYKELKIWSLDM